MALTIPTYFTAIDKFTAPLQQMKAGVISFGKTLNDTEKANILAINATATTAQSLMFTSGAAAAATIAPLGLATKAAIDFQDQMASVATIVDTTKESMRGMSKEVLDLATKLPVPIKDLTEALYQIRSAGVDASQQFEVLHQSSKLAIAGLSTSTEATKAVTSAMVSFASQGLTAEQIANSFFLTVKEGKTKMGAINESFGTNAPLVAAAGVKLQEFNALTAAMTNSGMTAAEAQNGLKMSVLGLIRPTKEMGAVLEDLNVTSGKDLITAYGLSGALDMVAESAKKLGLETPKLFNRTALTAYTLLAGSGASLHAQAQKNISEQMKGANALDEAFGKKMETAAAQIAIFTNKLETLGIIVGNKLLPTFGLLVGSIAAVTDVLAWWFNIPIIGSATANFVAILGGLLAVTALLAAATWAYSKALLFQQTLQILLSPRLILNKILIFGQALAFNTWTAAVRLSNISLLSLMSTMAVIVPFLLLIGVMNEIAISQQNVQSGLDATKTKFTEITKEATKAKIALEAYADAKNRKGLQEDLNKRSELSFERGDYLAGIYQGIGGGAVRLWSKMHGDVTAGNREGWNINTEDYFEKTGLQKGIDYNKNTNEKGEVTVTIIDKTKNGITHEGAKGSGSAVPVYMESTNKWDR